MNEKWKTLTDGERRFLRFAFWLANLRYNVFGHSTVIGEENIDPVPNMVHFSKHRRMEDSFYIGWALFSRFFPSQPWLLPRNVPKKKWFVAWGIFGWIFRNLLTMPIEVDKNNRTRDPGAYQRMLDFLRSGGVLQIFPEGKRGKTNAMLPILRSACRVVLESGAHLQFSYYTFTGNRRTMAVGRVFSPEEVAGLAGEGTLRERSIQLAVAVVIEFEALRVKVLEAHQR